MIVYRFRPTIRSTMSDLAFLQRFSSYYESLGKKPSEDQLAICEEVADLHSHFTEEDLRNAVRTGRPTLPKGIVAETLNDMIDAGMVRKIFFSNESVYYEHVYGHLHHDHLWCLECNKIIEFHDNRIEHIQDEIAKKNDFLILRHNLSLVGLCDECKEKAEQYNLEYHDHHYEAPSMPLAMVEHGQAVRIVKLVGGRGMRIRLGEMGLVKGETVKVIRNQFAGPFIIEVKGTKLVLAHRFAHHILVEKS